MPNSKSGEWMTACGDDSYYLMEPVECEMCGVPRRDVILDDCAFCYCHLCSNGGKTMYVTKHDDGVWRRDEQRNPHSTL